MCVLYISSVGIKEEEEGTVICIVISFKICIVVILSVNLGLIWPYFRVYMM